METLWKLNVVKVLIDINFLEVPCIILIQLDVSDAAKIPGISYPTVEIISPGVLLNSQ